MEELFSLYLNCLREEEINRHREEQDNKCFLELVGYINKRIAKSN